MKKSTRILAMLLALVLALSMAACSNTSKPAGNDTPAPAQNDQPANPDAPAVTEAPEAAPNTEKSEDTLTVMLAAEPTTLTGLTGIQDQEACVVEYATGARLYDFDFANGETVPSLAKECETIDETHYRITLRDDAHYEDGTPITAADVEYTIRTSHEFGVESVVHVVPEECKAEDDTHYVIAFDEYVPGWQAGLSETNMTIFSEAAVEAVGGPSGSERTMPVSAGRYTFKEWKAGEYMLLERNENYWDPDYVGYYKFIKVIWASDSASRTLAVKSGDADIAETISVSECVTLQNDPNAKPIIFPSSTVFNVYFNNSNGPFSDPKLREAVSYLIDSEGINQLVNMGMGEAVQGFIPKQIGEYYKDYFEGGVHTYDPDKAKELLAEAGYADGLTLECIVLKANMAPATVVQEALRSVGITLNVTSLEPANYVPEARKGNYDLTIGNNDNGFLSPDNFKLVNPEQAYDVIGGPKITDEAMIELVKRANSFDHDTAVQGWHDVIDYLFSNNCLVGLYGKLICHATNPNIEGLRLVKRGYIDITELHPVG